MCECSKIHLFEVEFKLDGMTIEKLQQMRDQEIAGLTPKK